MATTATLTSEQFLALPDEFDQSGNFIPQELVAGEIVNMPPASPLHEIIRGNIAMVLGAYLAGHPEFRLLPNAGFVVAEQHTFIPDMSIIALSRMTPIPKRAISGAPEIAVEVVSPSDTAIRLKTKIDTYLQNGSKTVWVVFPDAQSVMVYSVNSVRELKGNDKLEDPLLPCFSAPVATFFKLT